VVRIEDEISKIDDQHFRITRRGLDAMLGNMSLLARSARIVPETRGGKPFGFRLFSIRPASPFGLVGLENGDVIRSINDIPMTSPDEALKAYTKMKVANAVRFGMERRGAPFALEVTISGTPTAPPPTVSPPPRRHTASRADLDAVLHQPDLQILPQAVAGKPDGVRLAPASKLATLFLLTGFTPSDVIRAINGRPVSTKESFLEAYDAAIKTNRIEFSILRAGQPKALVVDVK
jgi:type II secretory pathway component PulC